MNTEIKNAIHATDRDSQYDEKAKRLLGDKIILAHILNRAVFYVSRLISSQKERDIMSIVFHWTIN